ncbi:MAG: efflux RND transporter permease subunit, partial [Candidatus Ornithomonoglobus sp.]
STAEGSETMKPLAIVLLGGLAVGTLLTLFVIPVIYTMFEKRRIRRQERKARRKAKRIPVGV